MSSLSYSAPCPCPLAACLTTSEDRAGHLPPFPCLALTMASLGWCGRPGALSTARCRLRPSTGSRCHCRSHHHSLNHSLNHSVHHSHSRSCGLHHSQSRPPVAFAAAPRSSSTSPWSPLCSRWCVLQPSHSDHHLRHTCLCVCVCVCVGQRGGAGGHRDGCVVVATGSALSHRIR